MTATVEDLPKKQRASGIDFNIILKDTKGKPMKDGEADLTVGRACELALDAGFEQDQKEGQKPKMKRGRLIDFIITAVEEKKPLELPSEDITLIKERVALLYTSAWLVRNVCLILDPASSE